MQVGFSESGKLEVVIVDLYVDNGMNNNLQFMVMEVCEQLDQGKLCRVSWAMVHYREHLDLATLYS